MRILLYHRNLSLTSGTGQLVRMQARGLKEAGETVRLACQRRGLKFFLKTGLPVRHLPPPRVRALAKDPGWMVVDHGLQVPEADLVFVHNVAAEASLHLDRRDLRQEIAREAAFFRRVGGATRVVANSRLVEAALLKHFGLAPERITVNYPGFCPERFGEPDVQALRPRVRKALGLGAETPVVGFVTSGDFYKRGLDLFLTAASQLAEARPELRFLIVGSKRLPEWAARHPLLVNGKVAYRPKSGRPHLWMAALDVFLYPARFEEFGMVISEAQASGVAIVTSRRVGAAECLPPAYEPWLLEQPATGALAEKTLRLLDDDGARAALVAAGRQSVAALDGQHYVRSVIDLVRHQKRRLRYSFAPTTS